MTPRLKCHPVYKMQSSGLIKFLTKSLGVASHLRGVQWATMTHVELRNSRIHQAKQLLADSIRIVLKRWPDGATDPGHAADQYARCDQVANQSLLVS